MWFLFSSNFFPTRWNSFLPTSNIWSLCSFLLRDLSQIIMFLSLIFLCKSNLPSHKEASWLHITKIYLSSFGGYFTPVFPLSIHSLPFWIVDGICHCIALCSEKLGPVDSFSLTILLIDFLLGLAMGGAVRYEWGQSRGGIQILSSFFCSSLTTAPTGRGSPFLTAMAFAGSPYTTTSLISIA